MTGNSTTDGNFRAIAGQAAVHAIDNLLEILNDAKRYLADGQDLAAWGTLVRFDDAAEDLKAAIRLHQQACPRLRAGANAGRFS